MLLLSHYLVCQFIDNSYGCLKAHTLYPCVSREKDFTCKNGRVNPYIPQIESFTVSTLESEGNS